MSFLKDEINKIYLKKIITKIQKKKSKTMWITIVIHDAMSVG
jgi:hypothetical protein